MKKKILILTSTLLATCMLASCSGEQTYTITFDSMGGSTVNPITVKSGEKLNQPGDPTKDKFTFGGWYTEKTYANAYDFSKPVTSSFTLYAKWESTATSLRIKKEGKKVFAIGSKLDLLDWKFEIGWSDGTYSDASDDQIDVDVTKVDMEKPADYTITVTLKDSNDPISLSFTIKVVNINKIYIKEKTGYNKFLKDEVIKWSNVDLTMVEVGTDGSEFIFNSVEELEKRYEYSNGIYIDTLYAGEDLKGVITSKYKSASGKDISCEYPYAVYENAKPTELRIDKNPDVTIFTKAGRELINLNGAKFSATYSETGTRYIDLTQKQVDGELNLNSDALQKATAAGEYECVVSFKKVEAVSAKYNVTLKDTEGYEVAGVKHNEKSNHNVGALLIEKDDANMADFLRKDHIFEVTYKNKAGDTFVVPVADYSDAEIIYDFSKISQAVTTVETVEFKFNSGDAQGQSLKYNFNIYNQELILVDGEYIKYYPEDKIYSAHKAFKVVETTVSKKYYIGYANKDEFSTNDFILRSDLPYSHPEKENNITSLNFMENVAGGESNPLNIEFNLKTGTFARDIVRSGENGHYYIRVNPKDTINFIRFITVNKKITKEAFEKLSSSGKVCLKEDGTEEITADYEFKGNTDIYVVFKQQDGTGQPFLGTFENKDLKSELIIAADGMKLYDTEHPEEPVLVLHYQFSKKGEKFSFVTSIAGISLTYENNVVIMIDPEHPSGATLTRKK